MFCEASMMWPSVSFCRHKSLSFVVCVKVVSFGLSIINQYIILRFVSLQSERFSFAHLPETKSILLRFIVLSICA